MLCEGIRRLVYDYVELLHEIGHWVFRVNDETFYEFRANLETVLSDS